MFGRLTLPLAGAAALVFACGPRTPAAMIAAATRADADSVVTSRVTVDTTGGTVRFVIAVANGTNHRVELQFPDGRTHDFVVLDARAREVWRWSTGRLFTQAMRSRLLDIDDAAVYRETWHHAAPGRYTLIAELRSANYPLQQRVAFAVQ